MFSVYRIVLLLGLLMLSTSSMASKPSIRVLEEEKFQEIAEAAHFLANYFEFSPDVYIVIVCKAKLADQVHGYTLHEDHPESRQFFITISSKISLKSQLTVIAHEMVHVKQFVSGALMKEHSDTFQWKGQACKDIHHLDYLDRPWEQEALSMQHSLIHLYQSAKTVR